MKTSRLAVPANTSGDSNRRVSVFASCIGNSLFDLSPSHWIRRTCAVGLLVASLSGPASAVNLAWNPNPESDIARYELSYGTSPGSRGVTVNAGLSTSASVTGLQQGVTYYFAVSAINQAGLKSAPSAEIAYLEPVVPTPPPSEPPPSSGTVISTSGWTIKYASSQETEDEDGRAVNAIDGNSNTYWVSRWLTNSAPPPHDLQIDTGKAQSIRGFRYLPRQDGYDVGNIGQYEFYISMDGVTWGAPVAAGTFVNSKAEKEVLFAEKTGRYVQLRGLTDLNGGALNGGILCCVAELNLLQGSATPVPVNQAPVAAGQSVVTREDTSIAIRVSASDADGNSLGYSIMTAPGKGSLSGTAPNLTYTPNADFNGTDSFTFRANDGTVNSNAATVSITVTPVNDAPVAVSASVATSQGKPVSIVLAATDKDGDALTYAIVSGPAKGTLSGVAPNVTYTPASGTSGADSFSFRARDGAVDSSVATVSITVDSGPPPMNIGPSFRVNPMLMTVAEDQPVTGSLSAVDPDETSALTYAKVSGPSWLTVSSGGMLGGIPLNAHVGLNTFGVKVTDSMGASASANLLITVTNTNDAPVFTVNPISGLSGSEGVLYSGASIAAAAADPDAGDTVTFSKVSGPEWLVVSGAGALSGTPPVGSNGLNTFSVRATDRNGASGEAVLQIQINSAGLPLPWNAADFMKSGQPGRASYASGLFTVGGTGRIGGSSDSGCYVWQSFSGNGTIIARVNSGGGYDGSALAGVMIRDSLASNSQHVFMGVDGRGYFRWVRRTITGGWTRTATSGFGKTPDVWVSLVRKDRTITAYKSVNGSAWTAVGSVSTGIGNNCYIGLAACSGGTSITSATFSDVQLSY